MAKDNSSNAPASPSLSDLVATIDAALDVMGVQFGGISDLAVKDLSGVLAGTGGEHFQTALDAMATVGTGQLDKAQEALWALRKSLGVKP